MNVLSDLEKTGLPVIPNALLKDHTTFKLGGACRAMIPCSNACDILTAVSALRTLNQPFLLMGFGSNILASDQGIDQIIIRYTSDTPVISRDQAFITTDAATQLDALVLFSLQHGLCGLEKFSGIPGTVGGAIVGNAGAYGQQISDNLLEVEILYPDNSRKNLKKSEIAFKYRDSPLKHNGAIVLSARFKLSPEGNIPLLLKEREEMICTREEKHGRWQDNPCAGSFFRNILPSSKAGRRESAGWFLEQAGCKGLNIKGAHSYANHANIITRDNGATAANVYDLTRTMTAMVKEKFNITLQREVRLLGRFDNGIACDQAGFW